MRFSTVLCAVGAFAAAVLAAENPITKPDGTGSLIAGESVLISWQPTTEGKVTLTLRKGESTNLDTVDTIVELPENTGSYEWHIDSSLEAGKNYAIMITSEKGDENYTPLLVIDSSAQPKPSASKKPTASSSSAAESSASESSASTTKMPSKTSSHPVPLTTGHSNSTMITSSRYGNSTTTKSGSKTSSTLPTTTSTDDDEPSASESAEPTAPADSGAISVIRSPLALVACLVGAIVYLN